MSKQIHENSLNDRIDSKTRQVVARHLLFDSSKFDLTPTSEHRMAMLRSWGTVIGIPPLFEANCKIREGWNTIPGVIVYAENDGNNIFSKNQFFEKIDFHTLLILKSSERLTPSFSCSETHSIGFADIELTKKSVVWNVQRVFTSQGNSRRGGARIADSQSE